MVSWKTNRKTRKKFKKKDNGLHGWQDRYGLHGGMQTMVKYAGEIDKYWTTDCCKPRLECRNCGSCHRHCTCDGKRRRPL